MHARTHARTYTHMYAHMHVRMHACIHTYTVRCILYMMCHWLLIFNIHRHYNVHAWGLKKWIQRDREFLVLRMRDVGPRKSCITSVPLSEPLTTWKLSQCTALTRLMHSCRTKTKRYRWYTKTIISHAKSSCKECAILDRVRSTITSIAPYMYHQL